MGDLEALQYANLICNEQGMDPISFGATVGAAMELYEIGVPADEKIGMARPSAPAEALGSEMVEMTALGEGFRQGARPGQQAPVRKVRPPRAVDERQGAEFPAYDSRGIQGMGLTYATSNRGACHLRGYTVASEVLGIPVKTDPLTTEASPSW